MGLSNVAHAVTLLKVLGTQVQTLGGGGAVAKISAFQANGCHFKKGTGKLVGGMLGVALPYKKTAKTQAQLTREAEVRLIANVDGLELSDIKTGVSDGAANEEATNRLEVGVVWGGAGAH